MEHNDDRTSGSKEGNDDRNSSDARDSRREESRRGRRHRRHGHRHQFHGFASWGRRKERVLHTRVSEDLHDAIHRAAEELRVPVSNLVRNALEDVTKVLDRVSEHVGDTFGSWIRDVRQRRAEEEAEESRPRPDFSDVTGWQPIVVNRPGPCADCRTPLERGDDAYLGLSATGAAPTLLCRDCLEDD
jgi:hypothetical protein